ncbi:MAG: sigma 54-interacting transcriptional regulator [Holophaga sp.]|nr:sigma 54-interacting transcriptional regulator [Holophaga sp.]
MTRMACKARFPWLALVWLLATCFLSATAPGEVAPRQVVLVLSSVPLDSTGFQDAINTTLLEGAKTTLDIYDEYTGLDRFSGPAFEASLLQLYNEKYAKRKVDLIIVVGPNALEFLVAKNFLPTVPVVTCYVPKRYVDEAKQKRPEITGAVHPQNGPMTLDLMLSLFPKTKRIHIILGASAYERSQTERARQLFAPYAGRLEFEYMNDLTLEQVEARLRELPEEDLPYYAMMTMDASGRDFSKSREPLVRIAKASRRPLFGGNTVDLGDGLFGGVLISQSFSAKASAQLGLKVLAGQAASSIPLVLNSGAVPTFDWRQLKRWGIRERSLPPGSLIEFRQVSVWDTYWKGISAGIGLIILEGLLVAGLIIQLRRRKRTERALASAEVRYRTVADFTHDWEFWQRQDGGFEYLSPSCEQISGYPPEAFKAAPGLLLDLVCEADRASWQAHQEAALSGQPHSHLEFRIRTRMGERRWVEQTNNPVQIDGSQFAGSRGSIRDITTRKEIERELAEAEVRYRTVADFTYDWEYWQRPDGTFEYLSPACGRVCGYTPEEFRNSPELLSQIVIEADRPAWQAHQGEALQGHPLPSLEYRIHTKEGQIRWLEQANNPVQREGFGFAGTRGSIRDITARKQSDLELKQAYGEIAALKDRLEAENTYYREKIQAQEGSKELLGASDSLKYLLYRIRQVAPSGTTVLIQGETGTGKELVAEAIHKLGTRQDRPLVKINCAALPPALAESELFGHEKGAFTGAQTMRKGRFEVADRATLFMDEVGELTPEVQAKLLRVLQDGEFQRVGGDRTLKVDVRVIAATNRDLSEEVAAGRFREDLWYRLNVFPITVPPLRERKEDIPVLAQSFLARSCQNLGRPNLDLPNSILQTLQAYSWPGNVRELQNIMERAVLVSEGTTLRLADPLMIGKAIAPVPAAQKSLMDIERQHILQVLESTKWKVEGPNGAAELLDMKPSTLRHRMAKLDIGRRPESSPKESSAP